MTQVSAILDGVDTAKRGACPTLDTPMLTGDGLLARLRVERRLLTPGQLAMVARMAQRHGNGLVEITARGSLQVRGLTAASAPLFAQAISAALPLETGLAINTSPIAGHDPHEKADPTRIAGRLRAAAIPLESRLGPKVSVVIDGGGQISLAALKADIRLIAVGSDHWSAILGGGKAQTVDDDGAVSLTMAVLGALAAIGPDARATDLFPAPPLRVPPAASRGHWLPKLDLKEGFTRAVALPFGQIESAALLDLTHVAQAEGVETLRLAPDHVLLIDNASDGLIARASALGFITGADDPRRRVSACSGSAGCASGLIAARSIAARLASQCPPHRHLHVSGCAKGCAHPRPADMTLVGRSDGIGLVIDGRAGDTPRMLLDEAALLSGGLPFQDGQ